MSLLEKSKAPKALPQKTATLRKAWKRLDSVPLRLLHRYEVWPGHRTISFWERLWWLGFHTLRLAGLVLSRRLFLASWHTGLKHGCANPSDTLVIVDDLESLDERRSAILSLKERLAALAPSTAPVLVTDHADFSLYSRTGWLVEYLPKPLPGSLRYNARKEKYLAWRYRYALVLPLSAGLAKDEELDDELLPLLRTEKI